MSEAFVLNPRPLSPKRRQRKLPLEIPDVPGAGEPGVPGVRETPILLAVLDLLEVHPLVAMAWRNNRGGVTFVSKKGVKRYIAYGGPEGAPDIIGFLKDGRFLAIEIKADGEQLTPEQAGFLHRADECHCVAMIVRQPDQVMKYLK